jgi:hypothetical protein
MIGSLPFAKMTERCSLVNVIQCPLLVLSQSNVNSASRFEQVGVPVVLLGQKQEPRSILYRQSPGYGGQQSVHKQRQFNGDVGLIQTFTDFPYRMATPTVRNNGEPLLREFHVTFSNPLSDPDG